MSKQACDMCHTSWMLNYVDTVRSYAVTAPLNLQRPGPP